MSDETKALPEYEHPPVIEVVCGVTFTASDSFTAAHVGRWWRTIENEFPTCRAVAPLPTVIEGSGSQPVTVELPGVSSPRLWFINQDEDQLVQVQQDRFLFNWRKTTDQHIYPRYSFVKKRFDQLLKPFAEAFSDATGSPLQPNQLELTYVNQIPADEAWTDLGSIGTVLPDLSWRDLSGRFLGSPDTIDVRLSHRFPGTNGRLHLRIRNGQRKADNRAVLLFEITARGHSPDTNSWFEMAHEWIVRGFTDMTGTAMHAGAWKRTK